MSLSNETICALSSAPGRAGVAVVRVSGGLTRGVTEALTGAVPPPRRASLRTIRDPRTGQDIDRAIVLFYAGPSSFTGEDVVEILLHGGRAVIARVLEALTGLGCRLAEPGEFARRAFEAGKIDLTEAEGIADLIDAETEAQRRQALAQAGGVLARLYEGWRESLITAMALTEAAIDFSDEADVSEDAALAGRRVAMDILAAIKAHLDDGRRGEILRDGYRVVLAGAPNVGKSSLLNALARREAAIVSAEAGTTRDVIEVRLDLQGLPVIVSDTAGLREATGEVEREGIRRTIERGREADLVVWVRDATEGASATEVPDEMVSGGAEVLEVSNKCDLDAEHAAAPHGAFRSDLLPIAKADGDREVGHGQDGPASGVLRVSALTGQGMQGLVARIADLAQGRIAPDDGPVITQARHRAALEDCARHLQDHLGQDLLQLELAAEDLRLAANALGRITGRVDAEDVLGQIFGRFCIGK